MSHGAANLTETARNDLMGIAKSPKIFIALGADTVSTERTHWDQFLQLVACTNLNLGFDSGLYFLVNWNVFFDLQSHCQTIRNDVV